MTKSGSKTGCIGIGNKKNASKVSSTVRRTSTEEGAIRSLFALGFHTYIKQVEGQVMENCKGISFTFVNQTTNKYLYFSSDFPVLINLDSTIFHGISEI